MTTVGALVIPTFAQDLTRLRRGAGSRVLGEYQPGALTATAIRGVVRIASGDTLRDLPEGRRQETAIRVTSTSSLRTAEEPAQNDADLVLYNGRYYEVLRVKDDIFGGFYQATCSRLAQEPRAERCFFGVGAAGLTGAQIALLSLLVQATRDARFTVTCSGTNRIYFAVPATFGTPVFEATGVTFAVTTVTIEGASYKVGTSTTAPTAGSYTVRVE